MGNTKEKDLINILYVSSFGWLRGGGQISLWNLLTRLDRNKFNPILICPEQGDLLLACKKINIATEVIAFPNLRLWNLVPALVSLAKLLEILKRYEIDIVHADDLRQVIYFGILKLFYRFRLIWHIRISWKNIFLDTIGFCLSKKIICTAKIIADKFQHLPKFREKGMVIYNAVDYDYFRPAEPNSGLKEQYNVYSQDFVIGTVCRLHPVKGIHLLVDAFVDINKSLEDTKLIIVGDGSEKYKQDLEKRIEDLGIGNSVVFAGFQKDVRPFLSIMDFFILPTLEKEGSSRSILEAMACGIPVLTTDIGGNSELVENGITGIIIPKPKPTIIATETIRLLRQKERLVKMGREGRKRVIEKFGISGNVRLTEDIYLSLLLKC